MDFFWRIYFTKITPLNAANFLDHTKGYSPLSVFTPAPFNLFQYTASHSVVGHTSSPSFQSTRMRQSRMAMSICGAAVSSHSALSI